VAIFDAKKMDHQNSGVPEFWPFRWTQIGNIRFAVVKPAGDAAGRASTGLIRLGYALVAPYEDGQWSIAFAMRRASVSSVSRGESVCSTKTSVTARLPSHNEKENGGDNEY
jgi:hypothetical protein